MSIAVTAVEKQVEFPVCRRFKKTGAVWLFTSENKGVCLVGSEQSYKGQTTDGLLFSGHENWEVVTVTIEG